MNLIQNHNGNVNRRIQKVINSWNPGFKHANLKKARLRFREILKKPVRAQIFNPKVTETQSEKFVSSCLMLILKRSTCIFK